MYLFIHAQNPMAICKQNLHKNSYIPKRPFTGINSVVYVYMFSCATDVLVFYENCGAHTSTTLFAADNFENLNSNIREQLIAVLGNTEKSSNPMKNVLCR